MSDDLVKTVRKTETLFDILGAVGGLLDCFLILGELFLIPIGMCWQYNTMALNIISSAFWVTPEKTGRTTLESLNGRRMLEVPSLKAFFRKISGKTNYQEKATESYEKELDVATFVKNMKQLKGLLRAILSKTERAVLRRNKRLTIRGEDNDTTDEEHQTKFNFSEEDLLLASETKILEALIKEALVDESNLLIEL